MFKLVAQSDPNKVIAQALEKFEREIREVKRGLAIEAFFFLVAETPQWSGHAASNWNLSIGSPDFSYDRAVVEEYYQTVDALGEARPKHKIGIENISEAWDAAYFHALGKNSGFDDIALSAGTFEAAWVANGAPSPSGEEYLELLEADANGFLRAVNKPGHMIERCQIYMEERAEFTPARINKLRERSVARGA